MRCSVVIPCFNDAQYLPEALQSVEQQTYRNLEVIVVNDGSTDSETLQVLQQLPASIKVINRPNGGLAAARNTGIRNSSGEIIVTLDSDDRFAPSFIEQAVAVLQREPDTGVVSSYVQEFGAGNKLWRAGAVDDSSFLLENRIVACCAFRRSCWEAAGGYDEHMRSGYEDWEFWIRVTRCGWKVHVIKKALFFYRKKAVSMLSSETKPRIGQILDYMMHKHQDWYLAQLKQAIMEQSLVNKKTVTVRRIIGLLLEKLKEKF